jgi:hypothetical protein
VTFGDELEVLATVQHVESGRLGGSGDDQL